MLDDEPTGYKRPPKQSQFKPGQSGNPLGRKKGTGNLKNDLARILRKRVVVREDGEVRQISAQQAMLLRLLSKALKDDIKAANTLIATIIKLDTHSPPQPEPSDTAAEDRMIIEDFLRRQPGDGTATDGNT